jgi:hypothetical protein
MWWVLRKNRGIIIQYFLGFVLFPAKIQFSIPSFAYYSITYGRKSRYNPFN